MANSFMLEIITPYRVFYSDKAENLIINSSDGELGILPGHEPIVTPVGIGIVKILLDGAWKLASFSDGFLEMEGNKATVLVGAAEWPEEIDVERAERSLKRASERLADTSMPWEKKRATLALRRAQTRIKASSLAKANKD